MGHEQHINPAPLRDVTLRAENRHNTGPNLVPRKPLEPPALNHQRGYSENIVGSVNENAMSNRGSNHLVVTPQIRVMEPPPPPPPHRYLGNAASPGADSPYGPIGRTSERPGPDNTFSPSANAEHFVKPQNPSTPSFNSFSSSDSSSVGVSLTLIRRDPATGIQWNVAKIHEPMLELIQFKTDMFGPKKGAKKPESPIFLEILNPGYSKFISGVGNTGYDKTTSGELNPPLPPRPGATSGRPDSSVFTSSRERRSFTRRMWSEGLKRSGVISDPMGLDSTEFLSDLQQDQRSNISFDSSRPSLDHTGSYTVGSPTESSTRKAKSTFRGYVFESPWRGRCEFSTGGPTRSLKASRVKATILLII